MKIAFIEPFSREFLAQFSTDYDVFLPSYPLVF